MDPLSTARPLRPETSTRIEALIRIGLATGLVLLHASPGFGLTDGLTDSVPSGLEVLCSVDCTVPGGAPDRGDGSSFEFELGLRAVEDGLDLRIETEGSLYLVGPLDAETTIELATAELEIGGDLNLSAGTRLEATRFDQEPIALEGPGLVLAAFPSVAPATPVDDSGDLPISIVRAGDVYLDLSGVRLGSLDVFAERSIVIRQDERLAFVPEPSTALLLALGLASLATGRRSPSAFVRTATSRSRPSGS
jgi:hypothetical protein